jgi:cytochrome P450
VGQALTAVMESFWMMMLPFAELLERLPVPKLRRARMARARLDALIFGMIADRRASGRDHGDLLSMLLSAQDEDEGGGMTDEQVRDEAMTIFLAGHETTANALTWTWYELGRNPGALDRLADEVRRVVGTRPITTDDLPQLPWTAAVIGEAMRLQPPVYVVGRETTHDIDLAGHRFPEKSNFLINIRGIHRRVDYYPNPLAFRPERMLPEVKKARPRHHYLPFGAGPRICIGSHFALIEAQLALATMVQHVRIRPLKSTVRGEPLVTLRPLGGMPAIVERC